MVDATNTKDTVQPAAPSSLSSPPLGLRAPSTTPKRSSAAFEPPSIQFLRGVWHVTHSTLPMWKSNRNVTITYTPQEKPPGSIDDLVRYQPLNSNKQKSTHGLDTPNPEVEGAYQWRGRGWLKIASSKWEVLGYGEEDGGWVVTFFAKTLFTPAGVDIYARDKKGLSKELLERARREMAEVGDQNFRTLVNQLFEIRRD